jgi:ribosomal-protein-alanine N-acetyltransferase
MAFFRTVSFSEQLPAVAGNGVVLRAPQNSDFSEWATLREASREFLTPWEPTWPADDLTRASFRRRIKRYFEDQRSDLAYPFFIFRKSDNGLIGGLTLSNIRRGCAQAGCLGYWMGRPCAQGHMTAAVAAVLPFAFGALRLHRVEAACIPANIASIRLRRRPIPREGFARQYLCIDGLWQDHLLFARLRGDPHP